MQIGSGFSTPDVPPAGGPGPGPPLRTPWRRRNNAPELPLKDARFLADTHEVVNVSRELVDLRDVPAGCALQEAVRPRGRLRARRSGRVGQAHRARPTTCARRARQSLRPGARTPIDSATASTWSTFHPAYHALDEDLDRARPAFVAVDSPGTARTVARAARIYLHTQVEAGNGCPITMTFAAVPSLPHNPDLASIGSRGSPPASTTAQRARCGARRV